MDIATAREEIGKLWGLDRPLTRAELARALGLTPDYISRLDKKSEQLGGPAAVALLAVLDGWRPHNMDDVIKPGYPRGPVK